MLVEGLFPVLSIIPVFGTVVTGQNGKNGPDLRLEFVKTDKTDENVDSLS